MPDPSQPAHIAADSTRYRVAHLREQWYVACRSKDLGKKPLGLTIYDTPIVVFRGTDGRAAALLDRCAHRNIPLSLGRIENQRLTCRYHGWAYDNDGTCVGVPALCESGGGETRRVPAFATIESQGFVWVFASPDVEPTSEPFTFPHLDDDSFGKFTLDYEVEASLHATLENMLDVPHTAFLHRGLFRGGTPNEITAVIRRDADRIEAQYVGEPLPSGLAARILGIGDSGGEAIEHYDRFIMPSISQVEYQLGNSHLLATSVLTPLSDFATRFSTVITYRLPIPHLLLRAVFEPVARRILNQDAWILGRQTQAVRRFEREEYVSTKVDILGPEIWRMLEAAHRGDSAPGPLERSIQLLV
jgi:phenylpropionate dioxygenase-like ring-hydroxylating dioxygenase large terminal subunit